MTQNERLRALLTEARNRLSLHMETYFAQQRGTMFQTIGLVERLDEVLAEPMTPVEQENARLEFMWQEMMQGREEYRVESCMAGVRADNAERREQARTEERDEARAEVATLRRQLKEAFYRGAEAMRQDAVKMLRERHQWKVQRNYGPNPTEVEDCAWEVNALPLPAKETQWPSSSETSTSSN